MSEPIIVSDPNVLLGKPRVDGTRVSVEHLLDELAAGTSFETLLDAYPRLSRKAIQAALAFAAKSLRGEVVYPLPRQSA